MFPCKRWLKKYTLQNHIFNIQFFFSKIKFIFVHPGNAFIMISFRFCSLIIRFVTFWKKMLKTSSLTIIQSKRISPHNQSHFDSNQCLQFVNLNWCVDYTIFLIKMVMLMIVVISMSAWCGIEAFCPFKCHCDDQKMKVVCSAEANLDIIPITLNPGIKEIHLRENQIR